MGKLKVGNMRTHWPCSLFLYSHLLPSSISSLSWPKAALTNPFTNDEAKFCRAESTLDGPIELPTKWQTKLFWRIHVSPAETRQQSVMNQQMDKQTNNKVIRKCQPVYKGNAKIISAKKSVKMCRYSASEEGITDRKVDKQTDRWTVLLLHIKQTATLIKKFYKHAAALDSFIPVMLTVCKHQGLKVMVKLFMRISQLPINKNFMTSSLANVEYSMVKWFCYTAIKCPTALLK